MYKISLCCGVALEKKGYLPSIEDEFISSITDGTIEAFLELWFDNIRNNFDIIRKSESVKNIPKHPDIPAIVVGAGPSVKEKNHMKLIRESDFGGIIIAVDRMLVPLLEEGIVPDFVINADGHCENILNFFDNPLVDQHASEITAVFATIAPSNAVNRFVGRKYFYNPMIDNIDSTTSITRCMKFLTKMSILNTTGNVGGFGVIFAYYLKCNPIAMIGLNYGYPGGTSLQDTYAYPNIRTAFPNLTDEEIYDRFYIQVDHPFFKEGGFTEPIFSYYKIGLLEAATTISEEGYTIFNCTEGGIIYEEPIKCLRLAEFLESCR
ncbi:MAG: hypothetical protein APR53_03375 [Methanoculleus sp. SDB]|nr:MAG: hypothetical protein APR53_03375 [Methanoculleus sp. SDB]